MEEISIKVRRLRETYGYSQESIAFQLGISQAAYCRRECGKTRFTFECTQRLAQLYQLPLADLLNNSVQELLIRAIEKCHSKAA
jgi:transcriptional regulator with XRE-family HTH domain